MVGRLRFAGLGDGAADVGGMTGELRSGAGDDTEGSDSA